MTEYEKYLFDLNGYLVIEDLLSKELVASLNGAIDHHIDPDAPVAETGLNSGSQQLSGTHARQTFGGSLDWPAPWSDPFRELMALPETLRYMVDTIGDDLRFVAWHVGACVVSLAVVVFLAVVLCLWACVAVVRLHVKTAQRQQRQRRTLASADRSGHTEGRR